MSEANPYEYRAAEIGENVEDEMFDHEARVRIAEALHPSHFPMMCFAILIFLVGIVLTGLALFIILVSADRLLRKPNMSFALDFAVPVVTLSTLAFCSLCVANWLWSCAVTIDRARKRLTVASVATAVQAQSVFWRKTGKLVVVTAVAFGVGYGGLILRATLY